MREIEFYRFSVTNASGSWGEVETDLWSAITPINLYVWGVDNAWWILPSMQKPTNLSADLSFANIEGEEAWFHYDSTDGLFFALDTSDHEPTSAVGLPTRTWRLEVYAGN